MLGCRSVRSLVWCLVAALVLGQAGCLFLAVGAAGAGAAAAGYIYLRGVLYHDFPTSLGDAALAVRASLTELGFNILEEQPGTGEVVFLTRLQDGRRVHLRLETIGSPIPVEAPMTRVGVRVGFAGDEQVSARILDQISRHLAPPTVIQGRMSTASAPPGPRETAPPPTLPETPTPVSGTKR
jgi:hypothetical protein